MKGINLLSLALTIFSVVSMLCAILGFQTNSDFLESFFSLGLQFGAVAFLFFVFNYKNGLYAVLYAIYFISSWSALMAGLALVAGSLAFFLNKTYSFILAVFISFFFIVMGLLLSKRKQFMNQNKWAYILGIGSNGLNQYAFSLIALSSV